MPVVPNLASYRLVGSKNFQTNPNNSRISADAPKKFQLLSFPYFLANCLTQLALASYFLSSFYCFLLSDGLTHISSVDKSSYLMYRCFCVSLTSSKFICGFFLWLLMGIPLILHLEKMVKIVNNS